MEHRARKSGLLPGSPQGATSKLTEAQSTRRIPRAEKTLANRTALVRAAAEVVGEVGYEQASVSRITERAKLAQGTFYLYFESRQKLFDILLPELTSEMLDYIAKRVHGSHDFFELEERGIKAFFDVVAKHQGLFRIVNETQAAAPEAFKQHIEVLVSRYESVLQRGVEQGSLQGLDRKNFRAIAHMLIGARNYLYICHTNPVGRKLSLSSTVGTYMNFVRSALMGMSAANKARA